MEPKEHSKMDMDWVVSTIGTTAVVVWGWLEVLAASNFFTALIGAGAGAFGGAVGALFISRKAERKDDLLREIRSTNAAIVLAFGVCNSFITAKKQYVLKLKENYDQQRAELSAFQNSKAKVGAVETPVFSYKVDFMSLQPLPVSVDLVQNIAFEKLSLTGRPLHLVIILEQTVSSLNSVIMERNRLIVKYKNEPPTASDEVFPRYFGLPNKDGHTDTTFPDTVYGIYNLTDDGIQFSKLLCADLVAHGERLVQKYEKSISKKDPPRIHKPDFSEAEENGLMPDDKNYLAWETSFRKS